MAGDKAIFTDAVKKGHNAAWDGQWARAVVEYRRALAEFPDDLSVRLSLAQALEEAGQWESALHEYQAIAQVQSRDPLPLTRIAALQEKLHHPGEAAGTYMAAAEMYLARKMPAKAVEAWRQVAALEPERTDAHLRLAEVYAREAKLALAAQEFLALARIYQKRGDKGKALHSAQRARDTDPSNQAARTFIEELMRGEQTAPAGAPSPMNEAEKAALSRLAETLLEEHSGARREEQEERKPSEERPQLSQPEIDALIARAVDAQMHRRISDAIESYRKLVAAGVARPEVKFNLGLLYFETMRYDDAIQSLSETVGVKNYELASHFALGRCFRALGRMDEAVEHFMQVIKIVDLGSVRRDQADELISVYQGLAESYAAKGDRAQAESLSAALEEFLGGKGWEDKVREVRHHLESLRAEDSQISIAEVLGIPESDKVLEALALSQEYLRRGKFLAATEECLRVIEVTPDYIPAHMRLGEVLVKQGRIDEAKAKYQTLAELCIARGDLKRAEGFYRRAIQIATDDVGARSKLIDLLIQQARADDALEQYLALGDVYVREGQWVKAAEKFGEGVRLAARTGVASPFANNLRHRLAETRARQGDFKGALTAYQEIRQHSPDDERAHFYVVDLEFRLGQSAAALRDLEALLMRYQARGEPQKATAVLEALVQSYPTEPGLIAQLAQNYVAVGAQAKAVAALDALGESQLSAGDRRAAAATIRQIIALDPPRVEDYKRLLQGIGE